MTSPISPEASSRIQQLRLKSEAGTITLEEMREAIELVRQGRKSAAESSTAAKAKKAKAAIPNAADLLADL